MDNQFLKQVASLFAKEDDLKGYTFIFPNRRSSVFFRMYLAQEHGKPMFAPKIKTISDVFSDLSDKVVPSHITLMMKLWKVWCAEQRKAKIAAGIPEKDIKDETADDFFLWGHILLTDFGDVDQYMVDSKLLFQNIKEYGDIRADYSFLSEDQKKAMERLFGKDGLAKGGYKKTYFDIWNMLLPVYESFRRSLADEGKAYSAMQSRLVAESISRIDKNMPLEESDKIVEEKLNRMGKDKVAFIGFSAPTECDKVLMRHFRDKDGKGLFYWDYFSSMVTDPKNRASHLIAKCIDEFKCSRPLDSKGGVEEEEGKPKCSFTVIPAAGQSEQALIASDLLKNICKKDNKKDNDPIDTAVVVSDETLLLPLMGTVGSDLKLNITMGYPFKATSAASFVNLLLDFLLDFSTRGVRGEKKYVSGDLLRSILNHTYIRGLSVQSSALSEKILKGNMIRIDSCILRDEKQLAKKTFEVNDKGLIEFLRLLVEAPQGDSIVKDAVAYFTRIVEFLSQLPDFSSRDRSFLNIFHDALEDLNSSDAEFNQLKTVCSILRNSLRTASVPFTGEPLEGVQVMGTLETRALDFEKIIILSFNEGIFPANGEQSSSIPYFLRKHFGLPTFEERDSVSAYNFYRLIQRAKEVYLIFDSTTQGKGIKTSEESRFIKQLIYDYRIPLVYKYYRFPVPSLKGKPEGKLVAKDEDLKVLRRFFPDLSDGEKKKYLSSSSLNAYLTCQRRFFLSHVLEAKKDKEMTDVVEAGVFGDIFHLSMQMIYNHYLTPGKKLYVDSRLMAQVKEDLYNKDSKTNKDSIIEKAFNDKFGVSVIEGENRLIKELVGRYIDQTINADCERAAKKPFYLSGNEIGLTPVLCSANFFGKIDRLEFQEDMPRICDYKTGGFVEDKFNPRGSVFKTKFKVDDEHDEIGGPYQRLEDNVFKDCLNKLFAAGKRDETYTILFQMLIYILMCKEKDDYKFEGPAEVAIYQQNLMYKYGPVRFEISEDQQKLFEEELKKLVGEIRGKADGSIDPVFPMCEKTEPCTYCDYKKYCGRIKEIKYE